MKTERVKGHLDLILLGTLSHSPGHGYAVITALRERTDGALDLTEGSVYPALHRLEDLGLLTSQWQPVAGRRRRLYRVTTAGERALQSERRDWRVLVSAVEAVLRPRASLAQGAS
ncbi:MAG: helix-turn-helix transcriptional regulator [Pseudonocardiales bacterium]|nr:helix-turn-helix transcriptional regulator [Actinomycetota bacterium]